MLQKAEPEWIANPAQGPLCSLCGTSGDFVHLQRLRQRDKLPCGLRGCFHISPFKWISITTLEERRLHKDVGRNFEVLPTPHYPKGTENVLFSDVLAFVYLFVCF